MSNNNHNKIAIVNGDDEWNQLAHKVILNKTVCIQQCGDNKNLFNKAPVFKGCETLFFMHNDKNFVYYWMDHTTFPNVKNIYFMGHPCEYGCLHRFRKAHMYLSTCSSKNYWKDGATYITDIESKEILALIKTLKPEPFIIDPSLSKN
jgi:hypothetical protein